MAGSANGNPPLFIPLFRTELGRQGAFTIANPMAAGDVITGRLNIATNSQLWGAEVNGYRCSLGRALHAAPIYGRPR